MKGYRNIEYFRGDRNSFIRIKYPRKWEIWWKGECFEVVRTRKIARESIRKMQEGEEQMEAEDRAMYEDAMKAMKKLIGSYILVGRLCERVENAVRPYLVQEHTQRLRKAQEEAAELLGDVTRFLKHAGDFLV
jgi:Na+/phosphate symporter